MCSFVINVCYETAHFFVFNGSLDKAQYMCWMVVVFVSLNACSHYIFQAVGIDRRILPLHHHTTTNRCITTYPLRLWSVSCTFCISGSTNHRDNELNIKILKRYLFTNLFLSIAVLRNSVACIISSRFMVKILFVPDNCWMGRLSTGEVAV